MVHMLISDKELTTEQLKAIADIVGDEGNSIVVHKDVDRLHYYFHEADDVTTQVHGGDTKRS